MSAHHGFKPADYNWPVDEVTGSTGRPLFERVTINWGQPRLWRPSESAPISGIARSPGNLYVLVRDHHKASHKSKIVYVGLTTKLGARFATHPKADAIAARKGTTGLSVGSISFPPYSRSEGRIGDVLHELEHILIWAIRSDLENEKKIYTLPGLGKKQAAAWHIINEGHRFAGRMPREIVYPWMLIKPGRDRSLKSA